MLFEKQYIKGQETHVPIKYLNIYTCESFSAFAAKIEATSETQTKLNVTF